MSLYKHLCMYLILLCIVSIIAFLILTLPGLNWLHIAFLTIPVSIFSVSLVCLFISFVMYKSTLNTTLITLKRRASRVYGELLNHKMRLIEVIDGNSSFIDIEKYLYPEDAFLKIKKFIFEEYFLLINYDPFIKNTNSYVAIRDFYSLHMELVTFIRALNYDIIEFKKFKILYQKIYRQPIVDDTPEENFNHPDLIDSFENFRIGLDYSMLNSEKLMEFIETHLVSLDKYFAVGVPWETYKSQYKAEFKRWIRENS